MRQVRAGFLVLALCLTVSAQTPSPPEATTAPEEPSKRQIQDADIEFVDSEEAYWVNKGFNDVLFYGAQGSVNAARNERDQHRSEALVRKLYRGPQVIGAQVGGKKSSPSLLKINGKEVKVSP